MAETQTSRLSVDETPPPSPPPHHHQQQQQEHLDGLAPSGGPKEKTSSENSEYDSVDGYSDEDEQQQEEIKAHSKGSRLDSQSDTGDSVILKREEGDGQESAPQKKVDDDEDKKNPQYIPKRGTFYEHDDRTVEDLENQEDTEQDKADKENKKKVWQDKKERWTHDRFDDEEQAPKSRTELIAIYGYDIRNEDGPPRARRRRRYGRGPNKYTRNWEDEDAYTKPPASRTPRAGNKRTSRKAGAAEEFPPLGGADHHQNNQQRARTKSSSSEDDEEDYNNRQNQREHVKNDVVVVVRRSQERTVVEKPQAVRTIASSRPGSGQQQQQQPQQDGAEQAFRANHQVPTRVGTGRIAKPKREIKDSDVIGFTTKTRQQRGVRKDFIQSQNFTNKTNSINPPAAAVAALAPPIMTHHQNMVAEMQKEISQLNIQDGVYKGGNSGRNSGGLQQGPNRQGSVPPRLQNAAVIIEPKGSKRYSSMRQRSLPETGTPPAHPTNFSFYPNDYNSTAPPPATQQPLLPPLVAPPVPVSAAPPPLLQAPFAAAAAFAPQPPPQAFLQAGPPTFMAPPTAQPQIVSYVTQAQTAFVPGYQNQYNAVTQPAELYQPQGGITYYSADQQIVQQRLALQKRPKAAIPIVAPTDFNREQSPREGATSIIHPPPSLQQETNGGGISDTPLVATNE